jgi:glycosyltransferase involved in cell wall biosynthesis
MTIVSVGAFGALGPQAPSFRVRTKIPSAELARHGVELRHFPLLDERQDAALHGGSQIARVQAILHARRGLRRRLKALDGELDVAMVQRQVDLLPTLALERRVADRRRLVLDVDDAIWLDSSREAGGHRLALLKGTERKLRWLAGRADTVIAGNKTLAGWLERYAREVIVVPSVVEHRDITPRRHAQTGRIVLGWLGSPSTAPALAALREPLRELGSKEGGIELELLVVGGEPPDAPGIQVRAERWSEEREREFLQTVDIGLMPLPDNAWTRGKCAYKALQYMAAGIPVVADDVGISAAVIGHGHGGLIARDTSAWTTHLRRLAGDADLREKLGQTGRDRVARDFSVETWAPTLAEILRGTR